MTFAGKAETKEMVSALADLGIQLPKDFSFDDVSRAVSLITTAALNAKRTDCDDGGRRPRYDDEDAEGLTEAAAAPVMMSFEQHGERVLAQRRDKLIRLQAKADARRLSRK